MIFLSVPTVIITTLVYNTYNKQKLKETKYKSDLYRKKGFSWHHVKRRLCSRHIVAKVRALHSTELCSTERG